MVLFDEHIAYQDQICLNLWSLTSKKCFVGQFNGDYKRNVFVYGSKVVIVLNVIEEIQWMKKNYVLRANNEWQIPEEKKMKFFFCQMVNEGL